MNKAKLTDIDFLKASIEDYDFYYGLKCEESNIYWTGHDKKPDYEKFKYWYVDNILKSELSFYIILWKGFKVGVIYYKIEDAFCCNYLGLAISEKVQGKGLASVAVAKLIEQIRILNPDCIKIRFFIREDNVISQKIHARLGGLKTGKCEERYLESDKMNILMDEWAIIL